MSFLSTKRILSILLIVSVLGGSAALYESSTKEEKLPENIVYISIDALTAEHMGCYGYHRNTAPNICGLENATLYENAYTTSSISLQALASMQTGVYHHRANVLKADTPMNESYRTIAEILDDKGYRTVLKTHNFFMNRAMNSDQGFDEFTVVTGRGNFEKNDFEKDFYEEIQGEKLYYRMHIMGSHEPYDPSLSHYNYTNYQYLERVNKTFSQARLEIGEDKLNNISQRERQKLLNHYDENIRAADHYVGRIINKLKEEGEYRDSLVIITADHGETFNNHGDEIWFHNSPAPAVARIPLVVKYPGAEGKERSSKLVSNTDPFKIILNEVGEKVDYRLDAIDPRYERRSKHYTYQQSSGFGAANTTHYAFYHKRSDQWRYYNMRKPESTRINQSLTKLQRNVKKFRTNVTQREYKESLDLNSGDYQRVRKRLRSLGYLE